MLWILKHDETLTMMPVGIKCNQWLLIIQQSYPIPKANLGEWSITNMWKTSRVLNTNLHWQYWQWSWIVDKNLQKNHGGFPMIYVMLKGSRSHGQPRKKPPIPCLRPSEGGPLRCGRAHRCGLDAWRSVQRVALVEKRWDILKAENKTCGNFWSVLFQVVPAVSWPFCWIRQLICGLFEGPNSKDSTMWGRRWRKSRWLVILAFGRHVLACLDPTSKSWDSRDVFGPFSDIQEQKHCIQSCASR